MRAVILAGGKGRRLAPYTVNFPKPLVPIDDMPILEIVVRQLKRCGFTELTFAVGHLAELLMAYFENGSRFGVSIDYSREEKPLGTVGPLALIDGLPETFLVMNGDVLTTLDYGQLVREHEASGAELTIAGYRREAKIDFGVLEIDHRQRVTGYREKPVLPYDVSMGVYIFNRSVLDLFDGGSYIDLPTVVQELISKGRHVHVHPFDGHWLDIGRPDDYAVATEEFRALRDQFLPDEPAVDGAPQMETVSAG
ncbi:MAG: sugar phosphate nucleotidyltransferase [Planctomycetota bacterium]